VLALKVSWIKAKSDEGSFRVFKGLGYPVYELDELENTDEKIEELIKNDCTTIILSNEVAGNSSNIITKYKNNPDINIVIAPSKK